MMTMSLRTWVLRWCVICFKHHGSFLLRLGAEGVEPFKRGSVEIDVSMYNIYIVV